MHARTRFHTHVNNNNNNNNKNVICTKDNHTKTVGKLMPA
jgi:hypothetical protein